jgi:hypothetical protein
VVLDPGRRSSGWDDPLSPNVYVRNDPKTLLKELENYALQAGMPCRHKSTSHKIEFQLPLSDGRTLIIFEISFEKGRKKRDQGLYRIRFKIPDSDMPKLQEQDVDFLTAGFLRLIEQFAANVENPLYSLE